MIKRSCIIDTLSSNSANAADALLKATRLAIESLEKNWDKDMVVSWIRHITLNKGRLILSGIGKSGIVAKKIAATMSSTGCPSLYIHPVDALHGDLGMVLKNDAVLILSNSGESEEIIKLLPNLIELGVSIGAITSRPNSRLSLAASWRFIYNMPKGEGCPLKVAPMVSTTMQLIWGDLLASCRMIEDNFTIEQFARCHPAGKIGTKLLKVKDLMHTKFPIVKSNSSLIDILITMTQGKLGMTTVIDEKGIIGIISDGDIRRSLQETQSKGSNPLELTASCIMTTNPIRIKASASAIEAARIMDVNKITFVIVMHGDDMCGIIHIHDLLNANVICK